jgi:hypothetical protein
MKHFVTLFFALLLSISACAQKTETRNVSSFSKLDVSGSFNVVLEQGSKESVRIEARNLDPKKIITESDGESLKIYLEKGDYRNIETTVYVTFKNLTALNRAGSGNLVCKSVLSSPSSFSLKSSGSGNLETEKEIKAADLQVILSGSGEVELASLEAKNAAIKLSGSGNLEIENGSIGSADVELAGSGNIEAFGLETKTASVKISGSGNVELSVEETLEGKISGSGNVSYKGNARINSFKTIGSGTVSKN